MKAKQNWILGMGGQLQPGSLNGYANAGGTDDVDSDPVVMLMMLYQLWLTAN